ncbi:MAG: CBS domain-containing protein [Candidatus Eisenbacteria bacterium]
MKVMVSDILEKKGRSVTSIPPQASVYEALKLMADKGIGALVVIDGEQVVGMFSERDYARKIVLQGRWSKETPVADVMTRSVFYVPTWRTLEECMALMTEKRVRHLPVLEEGRLVGLVSIGDVVRAIIADQQFAIQQLEAYVDEALKNRRQTT